MQTPGVQAGDPVEARRTRESLVGWGAPLAGVRGIRHHALHETLLRGLSEAYHDGTVLRVLPSVLARNLEAVDWAALREEARRQKLKAELGLLVELTAALLDRPALLAHSAALHDKRRRTMRFFPAVKSSYEARAARQHSPRVARRWGFWMNMSEESFRTTVERHRA